MKKLFGLLLILILSANLLKAHEGMWIPMFLGELNEAEMQKMGMKISAEDIYSINQASLKDAIVIFGRGCTGELVSDQGLLLTNHHCGYGAIANHSSVENDLLTNGFWAQNREEELSNKSLSATFLVRMEEVTTAVLDGVNDDLTDHERSVIIKKNIKNLTDDAVKGTHYEADIKPFFYGNQYFMFITEVFVDVRLVGAPPSNIGKFGGDTDNWMWPRHTGDFSVFRIYADKDNKPAEYSKENVPYTPKKHLKISLKGVKENDFTFVFGYPGRTEEYVTSYHVKQTAEINNPVMIDLRQKRLNIMDSYMKKDAGTRIAYATKYARTANFWKKMIGESRGIKKMNGISKKQELEKAFQQWADAEPKRKSEYGSLLKDFEKTYEILSPNDLALSYYVEGILPVELVGFTRKISPYINAYHSNSDSKEKVKSLSNQIIGLVKNFHKNYNKEIDSDIFKSMLSTYVKGMNPDMLAPELKLALKAHQGDAKSLAEDLLDNTILTDEDALLKSLDNLNKKGIKKLEKDPFLKLIMAIHNHFVDEIYPTVRSEEAKLEKMHKSYMKAQMEFQKDKVFYPDANFTLRIGYGKVEKANPRDAVEYNYFTTLKGIMDKENPDIYDYVVEDRLKELYQNKDYGQYADADGSMHVCFLASNHTTGGNSGSPLLDADGHLIGINFDRSWESTMSDLMYDPDQCRNITLDIRYCLFIIDKFAGASHLIKEMDLIH